MNRSLKISVTISLLLLLGFVRAIAQTPELVSQTGLTNGVVTVAFSPDGRAIVTSTSGGASTGAGISIQLWDAKNGGLIRTIDGEEIGTADSMAVSPDGLKLAAASGDLYLFSSQSGKLLWKRGSIANLNLSVAEYDKVATKNVSFSPDSKYIFSFTGKVLKVWDADHGKLVSNLTAADSVTFAPTGRYIVTELNQTVSIWDSNSLRTIRRFNTETSGISLDEMAISQNGEVFGSIKNGQLSIWNLKTGALLQRFPVGATPYAIALIDDGRVLAQLDAAGLRLYDTKTGKAKSQWIGEASIYKQLLNGGYDEPPNSSLLTFSPDGKVLAMSDGDNIALFDVMTGKKVITLGGGVEGARIVNVSPDQKTIAIAVGNGVQLWRTDSSAIIATLESPVKEKQIDGSDYLGSAEKVVFSPDSNLVAVVWEGVRESSALSLFNIKTGVTPWTLKQNYHSISSPKFSADATAIAFRQANSIHVYESATGSLSRRIALDADHFEDTDLYYCDFEFTPQRSEIIDYQTKGNDLTITRTDLKSGESHSQYLKNLLVKDGSKLLRFTHDGSPYVRLNRGGSVLAVRTVNEIELVDTSDNRPIRRISVGAPVADFELSPSGKSLITIEEATFKKSPDGRYPDNVIKLWNVETGRLLRSFTSEHGNWGEVRDLYFSDDERYVVLHEGCEGGCWRGNFRFWDVTREAQVGEARFDVLHGDIPFSFYHDIVLLTDDTGLRLVSLTWKSAPGLRDDRQTTLAGSLVFFPGGQWAVVDKYGNFDTNNLDRVPYLRWFISDTPLTAYALETFMREYYQPRLLARILKGEKLSVLPSLAELNRVQPLIDNIRVLPERNSPTSVTVKVDVSSVAGQCLRGIKHLPCESGVYDLRLYRDGRIVGQAPAPTIDRSERNASSQNRPEDLQQWRESSIIKTNQSRPVTVTTGRQEVTFTGIRLPQQSDISKVEFTAYAFNEDRVKSATSEPVVYSLKQPRPGVQPKAYVVTVGVDFTSGGWRLVFARKGAAEIEALLQNSLKAKYEVVPIQLLSAYQKDNDELVNLATRKNIQTVLSILSGRDVAQADREKIPHREQLKPATPDDLVILYIASHGYVDPAGKFYVIPSDIGPPLGVSEESLDRCLKTSEQSSICEAGRKLLDHSISSDELTQWIEAIDAGQMALILDSCHSGAVTGPGFKPGPMGDRSFGQLSYDKGMLVFAATQAEQLDTGTLALGNRSLLTYALTQQTLGSSFDLRQWLSEAEKQVPKLYQQFVKSESASNSVNESDQEPVLFDFSKNRARPAATP